MSGCEGYEAIPKVYERLNSEIDYEGWADFFEACFDRYLPERPGLVLDLACGTGSMTRTLARRGYDMIGVDGSENMLAQAYAASEGGRILYLLQDMRSFELYGTVGAVTCCLDSVNYLLTPEDVKKTFSGVHNYLDPDGLFLFDVNTPFKFREIYGNESYILEDEDEAGAAVYCGWQNDFDEETGICDFYLSLFEEQAGGAYLRPDEHQREKCYIMEERTGMLAATSFEVLGIFSDFAFSAPGEKTERWYFAARAKK